MTDTNAATRFCVLDLETTGLDDNPKHLIVEVAAVMLDAGLREIGSFEAIIWPDEPFNEGNSQPEALQLHIKTGLADLFKDIAVCRSNNVTPQWANVLDKAEAEQILIHWFSGLGQTEEGRSSHVHMVGRNPAFDRYFIRNHWPLFAKKFHHRMIDVDSYELLGSLVANSSTARIRSAFKPEEGKSEHRAMNDVRSTIAELHMFAQCAFEGKQPLLRALGLEA